MSHVTTLFKFSFLLCSAFAMAGPGPGGDSLARLKEQVAKQGGFPAIEQAMAPLREEIMGRVKAAGEDWQFKQGMHRFNRRITAAAIKPAWNYQPESEKGQYLPADVVIDFHRKLEGMGIKLIFVPVPSKVEAYPDAFSTPFPKGGIVSIGRVRTMIDLLEAGVEVVDVLPAVLAAKDEAEVPLYETSGHHLSGLGARIVGSLVAEQLGNLELDGRDHNRFTMVQRLGTERVDRRVAMQTWVVRYADGRDYLHQLQSQIAVIGDSNAFAFKQASWASHIARAAGVPIADHSTSSGGSFAHLQLAELGLAYMQGLKAVVWIVTSSHLERFGWPMGVMPDKATIRGLAAAGLIEEAFALFETHQREHPGEAPWEESQMNRLGYALLVAGKLEEAIAVFELNTKAFPKSANVWDSLGEGLKWDKQTEKAKAAFLHALTLNPGENVVKNAERHLADLGFSLTGEKLKTKGDLPPWPVRDDRLALIFPTQRQGVRVWQTPGEEPLFNYAMQPKSFAHMDRQGRLSVRHGQFHAHDSQGFLKTAFAGDFTLELFATPSDPAGEGRLWWFGEEGRQGSFTLKVTKGQLVFALAGAEGSAQALLAHPFTGKASFHCALTRQGQVFRLYLDGKMVAEKPATPQEPSIWKQPLLRFGGGDAERPGWSGHLEGIALHRAALDEAALAQHAAAYANEASGRTVQPAVQLKGRLVHKSKTVDLGEIAPYRRSLSVYEYEVLKVVQGSFEAKRIRVAHWTLMDGIYHPHRALREGDEVDLQVTAYQANRQLRNVHLSDTLPIDFDAELFYQTPF